MTELVKSLGIEWPILIAQAVNFAILLAVLFKFVYRPVMRLLDERREGIRKALQREEQAAAKLASAEADRESLLAAARAESEKIITCAREDGEALKQKSAAEGKEEAGKMRQEASKRIDDERSRLVSEVKGEIGGLVVGAIEKAFGNVLDARTQGKMVEQALAAIRENTSADKKR